MLGGAIVLAWLDFTLYGNIYRFMPIALALPLFYKRNIAQLRALILACVAVVAVSYALKYGAEFLINHGYLAILKDFAARPINGRFNGIVSGHCATAFIAVAFSVVFMRVEWKILISVLALGVCVSRYCSGFHTLSQIILGALIGLFVSLATFRAIQRRL